MKEHVNHPAHYNQHPSGVEFIVIIRHYTCDVSNAMKYLWRAGLKSEEGMPIGEKEVEDLRKAVWYLTDYLTNVLMKGRFVLLRSSTVIQHPANISIETIAQAYQPEIASAFRHLWMVGLISDGHVVHINGESLEVEMAISDIKQYISRLGYGKE